MNDMNMCLRRDGAHKIDRPEKAARRGDAHGLAKVKRRQLNGFCSVVCGLCSKQQAYLLFCDLVMYHVKVGRLKYCT